MAKAKPAMIARHQDHALVFANSRTTERAEVLRHRPATENLDRRRKPIMEPLGAAAVLFAIDTCAQIATTRSTNLTVPDRTV